jgi:DNA-binding NarL/FixJ family response regulator
VSRIHVVDDHPVFRKRLIALLRAEGHDVVAEASHGLEAVTLVEQEAPDLVLMDLSMPTQDGFEATTQTSPGIRAPRSWLSHCSTTKCPWCGHCRPEPSGTSRSKPSPTRSQEPLKLPCVARLRVARPTFPSRVAEALPTRTPRELVIADLVSRGLTNP